MVGVCDSPRIPSCTYIIIIKLGITIVKLQDMQQPILTDSAVYLGSLCLGLVLFEVHNIIQSNDKVGWGREHVV